MAWAGSSIVPEGNSVWIHNNGEIRKVSAWRKKPYKLIKWDKEEKKVVAETDADEKNKEVI